MQPLIIIRKSMLSLVWTFIWTILLSFLIVPVIYLIYRIIKIRKEYTEVYENRVIDYNGILNVTKNEHTLTKVIGVNSRKSFLGNLLGYGDLSVNLIGNHGLSFHNIANVKEVEEFFRRRIVDANSIRQSIIE